MKEVLASRTKIYLILEFIKGGELMDMIICKASAIIVRRWVNRSVEDEKIFQIDIRLIDLL